MTVHVTNCFCNCYIPLQSPKIYTPYAAAGAWAYHLQHFTLFSIKSPEYSSWHTANNSTALHPFSQLLHSAALLLPASFLPISCFLINLMKLPDLFLFPQPRCFFNLLGRGRLRHFFLRLSALFSFYNICGWSHLRSGERKIRFFAFPFPGTLFLSPFAGERNSTRSPSERTVS